MKFHLFQRKAVIFPTPFGFLVLVATLGGLISLVLLKAEDFLSVRDPILADVLVVEAWTKKEGADAAALEFRRPGTAYRYIVVAGGLTGETWNIQRWSLPKISQVELLRAGVPSALIILAQSKDVTRQRTFSTAVAAQLALEEKGVKAKGINVFTLGAHCRRSRLVFSKVFEPKVHVGVIDWIPAGYDRGPWWRSSERANDVIREMAGYFYELLLGSGRQSLDPRKSFENVSRPPESGGAPDAAAGGPLAQ